MQSTLYRNQKIPTGKTFSLRLVEGILKEIAMKSLPGVTLMKDHKNMHISCDVPTQDNQIKYNQTSENFLQATQTSLNKSL